jgi:crossover junction endodeoxyribonuclease RusA
MPNGAMLPAGTTESRKKGVNWRNDIRYAAIEAMGETIPSRGAIRLMVEFQLPYPVSSIRKYQFGWWPHIKQPDVDKLLRMLFDALTGIVWADDSQVCFVTCNKVYSWDSKPGAYVIVDFCDEQYLQTVAVTQRQVMDVLDSL